MDSGRMLGQRKVTRFTPAALREVERRQLDQLVKDLPQRHKESLKRLTGCHAAVGALLAQARASMSPEQLQVMSALLVERLVSSAQQMLGDAADDPSVHQLDAIIDRLIDDHGVGATRLLLAVVHDDHQVAGAKAAALLVHRPELRLATWDATSLDDAATAELDRLRACGEDQLRACGEDAETTGESESAEQTPPGHQVAQRNAMNEERPPEPSSQSVSDSEVDDEDSAADTVPTLEGVLPRVTELRERMTATAAALEAALEALGAGRMPSGSVEHDVADLRKIFSDLRADVRGLVDASGGEMGELESIDEFHEAVSLLEQARLDDHLNTVLAPVAKLASVRSYGDDDGAAARLRELATKTMAAVHEGQLDSDSEEVAALLATARLIEHVESQGAATEIAELSSRASRLLGADVYLIAMHRIGFPRSSQEPHPETGDEPSEPEAAADGTVNHAGPTGQGSVQDRPPHGSTGPNPAEVAGEPAAGAKQTDRVPDQDGASEAAGPSSPDREVEGAVDENRPSDSARSSVSPDPVSSPRVQPEPEADEAWVAPSIEAVAAPSKPAASSRGPDAEALVADAVAAGRLGLASWLLLADDRSVDAAAAKLLALATAVYRPSGATLTRFNEEAQQLDTTPLLESRSAGLVTLAAALRTALVAPYSAAPTLLRDLTALSAGLDGLDEITTATLRSASRGIQVADARIWDGGQRDLEEAVAEAAEEAATLLSTGSSRRIKFDRATRVWWSWVAPEGELGQILVAARDDSRTQVGDVTDAVTQYRKANALSDLIDDTDARLRSKTSRGTIEAGARTKLLEWAEDCLHIAEAWAEAVMALKATEEKHGSEREDELRHLQRVVERHGGNAVNALRESATDATRGTGALVGAAAQALETVFAALTTGQALSGSDTPPGILLGADLLRTPHVRLRGWEPIDTPDLTSLAPAARSTSWTEAFEARIAASDFVAAERIVELVRQGDPDRAKDLDTTFQRRLLEERAAVKELEDHAAAKLSTARRHGYVNEADLGAFEGRLTGLDIAEREDLDLARADLEDLLRDLEAARDVAVEVALGRLNALAAEKEAVRANRERVERVIADSNLATAEDMLALLESGGTLVEPPRPDAWGGIGTFFPGFVERTSELTLDGAQPAAAADGAVWHGLDFGQIHVEQRPAISAALQGWLALGDPKRRHQLVESLRPVLTSLGLQVSSNQMRLSTDLKGGDTWNWLEVLGARHIGSALVPQLGSLSNGRYRFLVVRARPYPERLLEFVEEASQDVPVIVLHLGTVEVADRLLLADEARPVRRNRSVLLIDDAALLFVLLNGSGRFDLVSRLTLPFTALNPYTPFVAGNVPPEMFYGRQPELSSVVNLQGTSFIYGGRQLGKSALLRAAERKFSEQSREHIAVYLDLKTHGIGAWRRKTELWPLLRDALVEQGAELEAATAPDDVVRTIRDWVVRTDSRVLALLDEADAFLEADAVDKFTTVSALKGLMEGTDRQFKPVFAGLHQVQRFLKIPNQPLAHFGRPIAVGPLRPDAAHDLVAQPLGALGYQLDSDDVVNRILAYANYQPSIIQLFGDAICRHGVARSRPSGPPFEVTSQQLETVYADREFADHVRHRFELTINLDPRYRVIAYTVALAAHERGPDVTIDWRELEARCRTWWPRGFGDQSDTDSFRSLLDELVGLGILARPEQSEYRLRSPNVLRMLGSSVEIEDTLLRAEELEPPQRFEPATFRRALGKTREARSPLTESQLAELTEIENRTHLVLGSAALGVEHVSRAVRAASDADKRIEFRMRTLSGGKFSSDFLDEEWTGHRVILGDLRGASLDVCRRTLQQAATAASVQRRGGVGIVLVLGTGELGAWREVLSWSEGEKVTTRPPILGLRRWDDSAVRVWVQDMDLDLRSEQSRAHLLEVTGGWPTLIARVAAETDGGKRLVASLIDELEAKLAEARFAAEFVASTGLLADEQLRTTWEALLEFEYFPLNDMTAVADALELPIEDAERELALLRALQVVVSSADGADLIPEPVVKRAWQCAAPAS